MRACWCLHLVLAFAASFTPSFPPSLHPSLSYSHLSNEQQWSDAGLYIPKLWGSGCIEILFPQVDELSFEEGDTLYIIEKVKYLSPSPSPLIVLCLLLFLARGWMVEGKMWQKGRAYS